MASSEGYAVMVVQQQQQHDMIVCIIDHYYYGLSSGVMISLCCHDSYLYARGVLGLLYKKASG